MNFWNIERDMLIIVGIGIVVYKAINKNLILRT